MDPPRPPTPPTIERRRDPRARASFPLVFTPPSGPVEASVRDVSQSGICAAAARPIPEMTRVRFRFDLPTGEGSRRVEGEGAVVRCVRRGEGGYEVAIFFTEVSEADRERIAGFVRTSNRL